ncbi:hypothetical protein BDN72DRAFT_881695 [Pluteus cervinus]|uniref:Uncharacterized protein n=1 Tax=Pluteus cervinus TaxID=181527 RepID=A0ACD3AFC8_9AGAR|nr:hypothetical protein BDN72DRAFT_881695 [Pluteus cervinus]
MKPQKDKRLHLNFFLDDPNAWGIEFAKLPKNGSSQDPFNLHIFVGFKDNGTSQGLITAGEVLPLFSQHFTQHMGCPTLLSRLAYLRIVAYVPVFCGFASFLMHHSFPTLKDLVLEIYKPKNFDSYLPLYESTLRQFRINPQNYPALTHLYLQGMFHTGFMGRQYFDTKTKFPWNQIISIVLEEWVDCGEDICQILSFCPKLLRCHIRYTGREANHNPCIFQRGGIHLPKLQCLHVDLICKGNLLPLLRTFSTPALEALIIETSPDVEAGICPVPALEALRESSNGLVMLKSITTINFKWSTDLALEFFRSCSSLEDVSLLKADCDRGKIIEFLHNPRLPQLARFRIDSHSPETGKIIGMLDQCHRLEPRLDKIKWLGPTQHGGGVCDVDLDVWVKGYQFINGDTISQHVLELIST